MTTASAAVASPQAHPSTLREADVAPRHQVPPPRLLRRDHHARIVVCRIVDAVGGVERLPDLAALPPWRREAVQLADRLVRVRWKPHGITLAAPSHGSDELDSGGSLIHSMLMISLWPTPSDQVIHRDSGVLSDVREIAV